MTRTPAQAAQWETTRAAGTAAWSERRLARAAQVAVMRDQGLSCERVAAELGMSTRTIERYAADARHEGQPMTRPPSRRVQGQTAWQASGDSNPVRRNQGTDAMTAAAQEGFLWPTAPPALALVPQPCTRDWGCICGACRDRQHPMDIMSRITPEAVAALYATAPGPLTAAGKLLCACGRPGRAYATGRWCERCAALVRDTRTGGAE